MNDTHPPEKNVLDQQRDEILAQVEEVVETTMSLLGLVWFVLLIVELVWGVGPILQIIGEVIWGIFIVDFGVRFLVASRKVVYLKQNWLMALSLVLPALRTLGIVRLARASRLARAARGARLLRVANSLNQGLRSLRDSMSRRGLRYVIASTALVTLLGAAGMYAFEGGPGGSPALDDYGSALWWTAMVMTTIGSDYWPHTPEGRLLCFFLSLYALGILGYVSAALASFFVGQDASKGPAPAATAAGAGVEGAEALRAEIAALREEIRFLSQRQAKP